MPAPLSIIMPTLNAAPVLGPTLASLKPGLDQGLIRELILSDGGSTDETEEIGEEMGAVWVAGPKGRGAQLARGADTARGAWLLFLHSDTQLSPNWAEEARAHLADPEKAAHFQLRFDASGSLPRLYESWANLRSRLLGLPYGDQGLLISRVLYDRIGGFSEVPLMEDVEIAGRLSGKLTGLSAHATTSASRYQQNGWLRQGSANLARLIRYKAGVPAERLVKGYK